MRIRKQLPYNFYLSSNFLSLLNFNATLSTWSCFYPLFKFCVRHIAPGAHYNCSGGKIRLTDLSAEKILLEMARLSPTWKSLKYQRRSHKIMVNCLKNWHLSNLASPCMAWIHLWRMSCQQKCSRQNCKYLKQVSSETDYNRLHNKSDRCWVFNKKNVCKMSSVQWILALVILLNTLIFFCQNSHFICFYVPPRKGLS